MEMRFDGRVAIITGGGRGIGRAHCVELARRGARIVVNDLGTAIDGTGESATSAEAVATAIVEAGGTAIACAASVATEEGVAEIADAALSAFGQIDILVHNAGTVSFSAIEQMSLDSYRALLAVHLDGGFLMARAVWPHMQARRYGRIVMTTSQAALAGLPNLAHYAAAKTGLVGLSRALSIEGEPFGIKSNALGVAAYTRMMAGYFASPSTEQPDALNGQSELWWERYVRPDIVSPVMAYLAHEECALSGEILETSGGHTSFQFIGTTRGYGNLALDTEAVRDNLSEIIDQSEYRVFKSAPEFLDWRNGEVVRSGADSYK